MALRRRATCVALALALVGCGFLAKKKPTGVAECDLYVSEYECFMSKTSGETAGKRAAAALSDGLAKTAASNADAAKQTCNAQRTAMAEQLKANGCLLGPAPVDAVALTVDASAPAVSKASPPVAPPAGRGVNGGACKKDADCAKPLHCIAHDGQKTCEDDKMANGCPMAEDFGVFSGTTMDGKPASYCGTCPTGTMKVKVDNKETCKPGTPAAADAGAPAPATDAGAKPAPKSPAETACDGKKGHDKCTFNGKPGECRSVLGAGGDVKLMCTTS